MWNKKCMSILKTLSDLFDVIFSEKKICIVNKNKWVWIIGATAWYFSFVKNKAVFISATYSYVTCVKEVR